MTNEQGQLDFSRTIELVVTDQCGKSFDFEQTILHPVIKGTELCLDDRQVFPMFNSAIPIKDLLLNGQSVLDDETLLDTLIFEKTPIGNLWRLEGIESSSHRWDGSLTMVDSCGFETSALIRIRNCEIPNVFTPNNDSNNDNFRIRGLDGFLGSQLLIYNRYGTVVFSRETSNDVEFELVWNGAYPNGNPAPSGHYQWVLLRSDGFKDAGELTLVR